MTKITSRLAPSPTGALHLGNARTFLVNWALARAGGWRLIMRIEDLDGPRVKPEAADLALDVLTWLGIDFDGTAVHQSHDLQPYRTAITTLTQQRRAYSCSLTRSEIALAASAPHVDSHEFRAPPDIRPTDPDRFTFTDAPTNYRFVTPDDTIHFDDEILGPQTNTPAGDVGDFVIWTKRGLPAYQLAVVVDDARQGVTDVVRGADLIRSTGRQILLYRALGLDVPRWWHLPLVLGPDGRRLAKRHGDTRVETYRHAGVRAERIVGLLGWWCGIDTERREMSAMDFQEAFKVDTVSREPVTFTEDDDAWLRGR